MADTDQQHADANPPTATPVTQYSLSAPAIEALADLAPTLKEAEIRVYLELMRREIRTGAAVTASSRDLANCCKLARSKTVPALDSLTKRGLLTTRQGTAKAPAIYQVNALRTVPLRGPLKGPPPTANGWNPKGTTQVPLWDHRGPQGGPPPTENKALTPAAGSLDNFRLENPILNRVLTCTVSNHDKDLVDTFRHSLHSYMAKFGRDSDNRRYLDTGAVPHPPDNAIVARFLAIGEPHRLMNLIQDLSFEAERNTALQPYNYAWFVQIGLSRVHGIHWTQRKAAEQKLRLHKRGQAPPPEPSAEQSGLDFADEVLKQAIGGVKTLR
jgi:hypothetical protein